MTALRTVPHAHSRSRIGIGACHALQNKLFTGPSGKRNSVYFIYVSTRCKKLQAAASERDANGIPSSTSPLHSHATGPAVPAQFRSLVVGRWLWLRCDVSRRSRNQRQTDGKSWRWQNTCLAHATEQLLGMRCMSQVHCVNGWVLCLRTPVLLHLSLCPSCSSIVLSTSLYLCQRLFANDVIMIGSVRADWPAPFSVTIGNPRADKLGRNGFECIGRRQRKMCPSNVYA